jgi:hypothetical protein
MQGFTLKSEIGSPSLFPGIRGFKTFVHARSGLTVHLASISGPLHSMAVVVPVRTSLPDSLQVLTIV